MVSRNRLFTILVATIIIGASCTGFVITDTDEGPDGFPPIVVAVIVASAAGGVGGWLLHDYLDSDDSDTGQYMRLATANNMVDVMSVASTFTANSNLNYCQLWGMTKEHWIRQAELEAFAEWRSGTAYDSDSVLIGSRLYENNVVMTANAVAQIDSFFDEISEKVSAWKGTSAYDGKMDVGFVFDGIEFMSHDNDIDADLVSIATGTGRVYIGTVSNGYVVTSDGYSSGYIYNFGPRTTISSMDGHSYVLESGKNLISGLRSEDGSTFVPGIYSISEAVIGGDTISSIVGDQSIRLEAGLAFSVDGDPGYAVWDGDSVNAGTGSYGTISFKVVPKDIPAGEAVPEKVDITSVLMAYQSLLDKLYWTSVSANSSADAIWSLYDRMDSKDIGVTTLMASNVYDSVVLSKSMNEILTISAMQQLASFYDKNGDDLAGLTIGLYGEGMDAPFVRGSIIDRFGNIIYDDVVFTPFFQSDDVVLERGVDYTVTQKTTVAVWSDGKELVSWFDSGMVSDGYEVIFIEEGYTFAIHQLAVCDDEGMHNVPSIELKVTKVDYISPGKTDLTDDPDRDGINNILKTIFVLIGAVSILVGLIRRSPMLVVAGVVSIGFAVFVADYVWVWVSRMVMP